MRRSRIKENANIRIFFGLTASYQEKRNILMAQSQNRADKEKRPTIIRYFFATTGEDIFQPKKKTEYGKKEKKLKKIETKCCSITYTRLKKIKKNLRKHLLIKKSVENA